MTDLVKDRSFYCKHNKGILQCSLEAAHAGDHVFNRDGDTLVTLAYPSRDPMKLEPNYSYHVRSMTVEGLHGKAEIAEQLAWRDKEIERLRALAPKGIPDITCPECGTQYHASEVEFDGDERDYNCLGCDKTFDVDVHVTRTFTCTLRKDSP